MKEILSRLQQVKKTGQDRYMACCPAHNDKSPSLSLRQKRNGNILINCFAGCSAEDIMFSIGMNLSDLFQEKKFNKKISKKSEYVLMIAENKRKRGERLTEKDLEAEREAYLNIKRVR